MSDVMLILALVCLAVTGFVIGLVFGFAALTIGFGVLSFAFADGRGLPWRS